MKKRFLCAISCMFMLIFAVGFGGCAGCKSMFKKEYAVSFFVDGAAVLTQTVQDGENVSVPDEPVKDGYVFKGWYTDENYTSIYDFSKPIDGETSVYAYFKALYNVSFLVDGEAVSLQSVEEGCTATAPADPEKEGYAFIGWYLDEALTAEYDFAGVQADLAVYAGFIKTYVVSFMVDENVYATQTVKIGENVVPENTPEKDYAIFKKWCIDEECTFQFDFATPIYEDTVVYAYFVDAYKVNYADEEGNVLFTTLVEVGATPTRPVDPEKEGYKLLGWYFDLEYTNQFAFDAPIADGTILYPLYEKIIKIYSADGLREIANKPDGIFQLAADINLNGEAWTPINNFSGELNGDGYKIVDFTMAVGTENGGDSGFVCTNNGILKNIVFADVLFNSSGNNVGVIAGVNNGTIENCEAINVVSTYKMSLSATSGSYSYYFGGLVGINNGLISGMQANINLNVNASTYCGTSGGYETSCISYIYIGGAVGYNLGMIEKTIVGGSIDHYATASGSTSFGLYGYGNTVIAAGGFAGKNARLITDCGANQSMVATDSVKSHGSVKHWIGGFAYNNIEEGSIEHCYAKTEIIANGCSSTEVAIGGFIENNSALIKDCYADSCIETNNRNAQVAGFAIVSSKMISTSYAIGTITVQTVKSVGGFIMKNAQNNTINGCFSAMNIFYENVTNFGVFATITEDGSYYEKCHFNANCKVMHGLMEEEIVETNNNVSALSEERLYSTETLYDSLRWSKDVWNVDGENPPTLFWEESV